MKRFISVLMIITMLAAALVVNVSAATDYELSATSTEGKPGDTIKIDVYLDKNPGTWAASFELSFDSRCFKYISVTYGDIFAQAEQLSNMKNSDTFLYFANKNDIKNTEATGLLLTIELRILEAAPNGEQKLNFYCPQEGVGWFFDANDPDSGAKASFTNESIVTITNSDAAPLPETQKPEDTTQEQGSLVTRVEDEKTYETRIETAFVTDDSGAPVIGEDGMALTEEVVVTVEVTDADTDQQTNAPEDTDADKKDDGSKAGTSDTLNKKTIVIIVICVCVVAAVAIIIILLLTNNKKNKSGSNHNSDSNNNGSNDYNNNDNNF